MSRFENLLTRCKKQDQQAMMELYNISALPVYNASFHIVMNKFDAEEIMQDSILKAFDNIDRFLGTEKEFVTFVKKIAINKSIDWFRKNNNSPLFTEIEDLAVCNQQSSISDEEENSYSFEMIKEKIELLPRGYKMVLNLHLIDEIDFDDIAEIMNIKPSSVRSQYVRAIDKLRFFLESEKIKIRKS